MARPQKRKRQRADDARDHIPSKKAKTSAALDSPPNFGPEFYDNLSTIWLTPRALREFNRRNDSHQPLKPTITDISITSLAEFAKQNRRGGPDLCDLRGYPGPTNIARTMASASSASSKKTQSTKATTVSSKSKRSSAYDANFEQHLIDHNIYPPLYDFPDSHKPPKPGNWEEIRQALKVPRGSLSPSVVPKSAFEEFQRRNKTKSEGTVMRNVVPLIAGNADIPNEGHLWFTNLDSITGDTTVNPVPDFFDGAWPGAVDKTVREDLDRVIIPTRKAGVPVAPNFFLEAKAPGGTLEVAERQAVLDGAHGALMMHALQNYLEEEPVYDGNAYAFTSTLLGGYLTLFAHHLTAPAKHGQRPGYHITQLKAYALRDDETQLEGTGAFRQLRQLAKEYRNQFIEVANARARNLSADAGTTEGGDPARATEEQQDGGSSPIDFFECQMFADPEENDQKGRETRETQETQETQETEETQENQEANVGLAILDHAYGRGDTEEHDRDFSLDTEGSKPLQRASRQVSHRNLAAKITCVPSVNLSYRAPPSPSSTRQLKRRGSREG